MKATCIKILLIAAIPCALLSTGCSTQNRPVQTEHTLLSRCAENEKSQREVFFGVVERMVDRVTAKSADKKEPATVDLLAMSGGGDKGAFGAGFLVGWGESSDESYRRPDFDAVTGVSTGALLAPFAFLGTDSSCKLVEAFYRHPKKDWVKSRFLFFLPNHPSFMTLPGLEREIDAAVDDTMIRAMAAESAKGKALLIAATDLDSGTQHFWDLSDEAAKSLKTGDQDRVRKILLASAAIPAVFPPVIIGDSAYADGGVTANVFLRLDPDMPEGFINVWRRKYPGSPLPKVRYWVIINNQLHQPPKTVQPKWLEVMAPSLDSAVRSATVAEVRWLTAQANYANAAHGTNIEVRVVAIPDEWRPPVPGQFKKETMESLTDLGRKLGAEKSSWQVWAAPKKNGAGG
ncbi:MAG: patatin-like phospholipase family protein [Planctomycetes bacterium]|nr:patatin-like phospholipase family protein [Planctomycetota bacterium]